jgi:nicotinate phosphoribosyltransferase
MTGLDDKIKLARESGIKFSEFGTRRRYSHSVQNYVCSILAKNKDICTGTSNVYFARRHSMPVIGTVGHEWYMAAQGCDDVTLANSQKYMLQKWVDEYRGDLGIALSDTLGIDKFLKDFDPYFAKLYDGVRHDSGDPFEWGEKIIKHYEKFKIDPKTKTLVFSDGLTFPIAAEIQEAFGDRAKVVFGIGTNLTNDFEGVKPLNIVIKMTECNGRPVAKISDTPGKTMCEDQKFIEYLRSVI